MFPLLRAGLCNEPVDAKILDGINADLLSQLYAVSDAHDLAHIVGTALAKCGKLGQDDCAKNFRGKAMLAVSRYERIRYDLQSICDTLEQMQIPFIPLKGSVLRQYYPEPWMRTSCDIDVLVHKEDLDAAEQVLRETLGYTPHKGSLYDMSFYSQSGIHIELHFGLIDKDRDDAACQILKNVWDYAVPRENHKFWHELSDAMFYCYHIAHTAKHFEQGGCGIRPFIDLWLLDNAEGVDVAERDKLLQKGDLLKFARAARRLVKVWFEGMPQDSLTMRMQEYIIRGGIYGSISNQIVVMQKQEGGKWKYAFLKILPPYDVIKFVYPVLQKHPWLTPIMQMRRWFRLVFGGHMGRSVKQLSYSKNVPEAQIEAIRQLFWEIGL